MAIAQQTQGSCVRYRSRPLQRYPSDLEPVVEFEAFEPPDMVRIKGIAPFEFTDVVLRIGLAFRFVTALFLLASRVRLRLSMLAILSEGSVGEVGVDKPDSGLANSSE